MKPPRALLVPAVTVSGDEVLPQQRPHGDGGPAGGIGAGREGGTPDGPLGAVSTLLKTAGSNMGH